MFKKMICRLFRHRRSRGQARRTADGVVSRCRRCGVAMQRTDQGKWVVRDPVG